MRGNYFCETLNKAKFQARPPQRLDSKTLSDIGTPTKEFDMTIQRIYSRVNDLYGKVIGSELEVETQKLAIPLESLSDFDHLLEIHVAVHALADEGRVPVSNFDKLKFFKAAIQHHEEFKVPIQMFEATTDHHNNTRTWPAFKDAMVKAHCNIRIGSKSSHKARGKANNVSSKHQREETEDSLDSEESTPAAKKSTGGNTSAFSAEAFVKELYCHLANQITEGAKLEAKAEAPHYCWSHGYGNHPSKDCEKTKTGHIEDCTNPTKENKGNTHVFRRYKK